MPRKIDGVGRRIEKRQVVIERRRVQRRARAWPPPECDLISEPNDERAVALGIVERLDADAIAREQQRAAAAVPERDAEHAAQVRERVLAPLLVGVDDGLGVGVGVERVAVGDELGAQLAVVVDLAVEDDPDRAVLVAESAGGRRRDR